MHLHNPAPDGAGSVKTATATANILTGLLRCTASLIAYPFDISSLLKSEACQAPGK
jgi:hypothetical protein